MVGSVLLLSIRPCRAEAAQPDNAIAATTIRIHLVGATGVRPVEALLTEWFRTSGLSLSISWQPSLSLAQLTTLEPTRVSARLWITLPSKELGRVYLADAREHRFLVSDVQLESGLDELGRERLAQAALSSTLAFLERESESSIEKVEQSLHQESRVDVPTSAALPTSPVPRMPGPPSMHGAAPHASGTAAPAVEAGPAPLVLPAPLPPPVPVPVGASVLPPTASAPDNAPRLAVGASYSARLRGDESTGHGPGAWLSVLFDQHPGMTPGVALWGRYEWRVIAQGESLNLAVATFAARALFLGDWRTSSEHRFSLGLGGGMDWVQFEPRARTDTTLTLAQGDSELRPMAMVLGRILWDFDSWFLAVAGHLDLALRPTRFSVRVAGVDQREFTPWRLQPGLSLMAGWH